MVIKDSAGWKTDAEVTWFKNTVHPCEMYRNIISKSERLIVCSHWNLQCRKVHTEVFLEEVIRSQVNFGEVFV